MTVFAVSGNLFNIDRIIVIIAWAKSIGFILHSKVQAGSFNYSQRNLHVRNTELSKDQAKCDLYSWDL